METPSVTLTAQYTQVHAAASTAGVATLMHTVGLDVFLGAQAPLQHQWQRLVARRRPLLLPTVMMVIAVRTMAMLAVTPMDLSVVAAASTAGAARLTAIA